MWCLHLCQMSKQLVVLQEKPRDSNCSGRSRTPSFLCWQRKWQRGFEKGPDGSSQEIGVESPQNVCHPRHILHPQLDSLHHHWHLVRVVSQDRKSNIHSGQGHHRQRIWLHLLQKGTWTPISSTMSIISGRQSTLTFNFALKFISVSVRFVWVVSSFSFEASDHQQKPKLWTNRSTFVWVDA